jgi:hypothetical protein
MFGSPSTTRSILFALAAGLAAVAVTVVAVGAWTDRAGRSAGPEAPLSAYVAAVEGRDLESALEQLVPGVRATAAPFVEWELGNRYVVLESAVRSPSALDRWAGEGDGDTRVAVILEIHPKAGDVWRATEEIPVARIGDRWYLLKPPLQPPS